MKPPASAATAEPEDAQRGDRYLRLARRASEEKGFEGTSTQDVARTAQMSVGKLNRDFPSSTAPVEALMVRHFAKIESEPKVTAAGPDPMAALMAAMRGRLLNNT